MTAFGFSRLDFGYAIPQCVNTLFNSEAKEINGNYA